MHDINGGRHRVTDSTLAPIRGPGAIHISKVYRQRNQGQYNGVEPTTQ